MLQQRESAIQWIDFIAQASQGAVTAVDPDLATQTVTNMKRSDSNTSHDRPDAILELFVTGTEDGETIKVREASLNGVSQEIGELLLDNPLIGERIPIRILQFGRSINVDESGRVTVAASPYFAQGDLDIRNAEKLASIVLSRSLRQWGVTKIKTDAKAGD
jgi:hypothetical protein